MAHFGRASAHDDPEAGAGRDSRTPSLAEARARAGGVVSLSTVPERLAEGLMHPTIKTLLMQTVVLPVIVAVPWRSTRFPDKIYRIPDWLNATLGLQM